MSVAGASAIWLCFLFLSLFKLEIGEISSVVESPYGFHVLTRLPLEQYQMSAAQILIRHAEGIGAPPSIQRTKEEASALAEKILAELNQPEADFAELARRWSEHPTAAEGGNLGTVRRGNVSLPPGVEEMVFALRPGEISEVFQTPQGFHILLCWE
ncbi:MAG: peptidylprolyl isomerase [Planctomycetes bacterium]|nr:peptidylprolyl isomerase [Planctomycetota bacterium]